MIYAVVLSAPDELSLAAVEQRLAFANIRHKAIREPDMGNALTAIGVEPVEDRRPVQRAMGRLPLLGREKERIS